MYLLERVEVICGIAAGDGAMPSERAIAMSRARLSYDAVAEEKKKDAYRAQ